MSQKGIIVIVPDCVAVRAVLKVFISACVHADTGRGVRVLLHY